MGILNQNILQNLCLNHQEDFIKPFLANTFTETGIQKDIILVDTQI